MKCLEQQPFWEYLSSDGTVNNDFLQVHNYYKKQIIAASKLFFDRFHIAYSIKKKKNWKLIDETKRNISGIQDERASLLVMVVKVNSSILYQSEKFVNTLDHVPVDEIHLIDVKKHEIHMKTKDLLYGEIFHPHKAIRQNVPSHVWYKKRISRRYHPAPILNLSVFGLSDKVVVVLKELISKYSNRWLNMDKKWIRKYKYNEKNGRKKKERKDRRFDQYKNFFAFEYEGNVYEPFDEDFIEKWFLKPKINDTSQFYKEKDIKKNGMKKERKDYRNKKFFLLKYQEYESYNEDLEEIQFLEQEINEIFPTLHESHFCTSDFFVDRSSVLKSKRQRKGKIPKIRSKEFEQWFSDNPAHELHEDGFVDDEKRRVIDSKQNNVFSYVPLPLYNIFLNQQEAEFVKCRLLPNTQPVSNIIPISYTVDFNWRHNPHLELPEFLKNYYGSIIIQPILYGSSQREFLRIILNPFTSEDDKFDEDVKSSLLVSRSSFEKFLPRTVQLHSYDASSACCIFLQEMFLTEYEDQQDELCLSSYDSDFYCSVCGENDKYKYGFALQCKHYFCADCWGQYAVERISLARVPVLCLKTFCNEKLSLDQMRIFLSSKICNRYKNLLFNKGMMRKEWTYCRKCSKILHIPECSKIEKSCGICKCGSSVCLLCEGEVHFPLSCNEYEPYANVVAANENNLRQLNVNNVSFAKCPKCGTFCEKNEGCDHIVCICNFDFCYQCGEAWRDDLPHYACKAEFEQVNLYDVPIKVNNKIPLNVVEECFTYRRSDKESLLMKYLLKILKSDCDMLVDVRSTYFAITRFMEMLLLKIHYTKSYLKIWRKRSNANKMNINSIKLRILLKSKNRLCFSFSLFCSAINERNRMKIIRSKKLLDSTLQACIAEII